MLVRRGVSRRAFIGSLLGLGGALALHPAEAAGWRVRGRTCALRTQLQFRPDSRLARASGYQARRYAEVFGASRVLPAALAKELLVVPIFSSSPPGDLADFARSGGYYSGAAFFSHYQFHIPLVAVAEPGRLAALRRELLLRPDVGAVRFFLPAPLPGIAKDPQTDEYADETSTWTHGLADAWKQGYDGSGVRIYDLERGWGVGAGDGEVPPFMRLSVDGGVEATDESSVVHGTGVLSTLGARANSKGITGVAPGAEFYAVPTLAPLTDSTGGHGCEAAPNLANAVQVASAHARAGDILLLEEMECALVLRDEAEDVIRVFGPADGNPAVLTAVGGAIRKRQIVIEPVGTNEVPDDPQLGTARDIGKHRARTTQRPLPELYPVGAGRDLQSGAIFVTAFDPASGVLLPNVNYGESVDCAAWGARRAPFSGADVVNWQLAETSLASALIAGIAALVQQQFVLAGGIDQSQMRKVLCHRDVGELFAASGSRTRIPHAGRAARFAPELI